MNSTYFNILSSSNEFNQCDNPIRSIDSEPTQIMLFIIRLSSILMYSVLFLSSKNIYSLLGFALLILQLLFFIDSNNGLIFSILLSILSIRIVLSAGELISYLRVEFMEFIGLVLTSNFNILTTQSDEDDSFYAEYKVSKNASSSVSTLLSICNMKDELEYTDAYATKVWRRVPSDSKTSTWISKAPSDGILFHTSCIFEATPDEVLLLISEEHSPSGLEHISFQYENLCVSKNNNIFIKNFFVESGSVQASNRILTVVSGIVSRENGIIILHSRSSNVPEHIDFKSREPCEPNGYIRGILYASGFIIKPLECTLGSTKPRALVQFAIHLDLLGSITGRANRYNRDVLLQSIQTLFRNVQSRCAERNSLNLPSAPRTMETDMVSPSSCSGSGSGSGVNSSCRSTPRASHNSCPITLNVPVHLNAVESRITQSAEKHLQSAHTLILELRAEQKAAIDVFYRSQSLEALSDIPKLSPKKTWRAVTSRTQLFGGGSGTKEDKNRPRSRSVSPHATPIRSGAAVIDEPVDLLLHRSSIKVWNHKRHNVLSAVMHLETHCDLVKAAILSGTYGLDSLLAFNLKLLDINPLGHAQLSWRSYHGPTPINSRDAFLLSSERSLGLESAIPSSASKMVSSGSQEILYQALGKPDRASSTSTSTLSRVSSFLRKTPPPAPSQRGSPATSSKSEPVRDNTAGFVFAWTSFDDVCDNILELRHAVERAVPGHPIQISDYTRMSMCVGGWLCESSPTGGCDVSLFIDSNLYDDLSHWMTNVLTQSIMIESMEDLRTNVIASMPTSNDKSRHSYHCLPDSLYGGIRQQLKRISEDAEHAHTGHEPIFKYQSPQSKLVDGNHNDNYFSPLKDHERTQHKLVEKLKIPLQTVQAELDTTSTTSSAPSSGRQNSSTEPSESQDDFHTPRRNKIVSARTPRSPQSDHSVTPLRAIKQHIRSLGYTDFSVESINMLFQYTDFVEMSASGEPVVRPPSTLVWQIRSKRDDMTLYKTMVPGSTWQLIKCSCYMNFKKEPIQQLLSDDSRLGLYDDMFDYCTYLHSSDPFTNVRRMCFKPVWPTSPRDFVVATTTYHMADGSALLATRSQSGIMDEQAGYVRGRLHVSGFLIVPCSLLPEDPVAGTVPDGCRVTLVVHIDLGGNLPSGPLNYFTMNAPLRLLSRVKEVLLQDQIAAGSTKINDE